MDLKIIIMELLKEKKKLDRVICQLEKLQPRRAGRPPGSKNKKEKTGSGQ